MLAALANVSDTCNAAAQLKCHCAVAVSPSSSAGAGQLRRSSIAVLAWQRQYSIAVSPEAGARAAATLQAALLAEMYSNCHTLTRCSASSVTCQPQRSLALPHSPSFFSFILHPRPLLVRAVPEMRPVVSKDGPAELAEKAFRM